MTDKMHLARSVIVKRSFGLESVLWCDAIILDTRFDAATEGKTLLERQMAMLQRFEASPTPYFQFVHMLKPFFALLEKTTFQVSLVWFAGWRGHQFV